MPSPFHQRILLLNAVAVIVTVIFMTVLMERVELGQVTIWWLSGAMWLSLVVLTNRVWHIIPTPEDGCAAGLAWLKKRCWSLLELVTYRRSLPQWLGAPFEYTDRPKVFLAATDDRAAVVWSLYQYRAENEHGLDSQCYSVWRTTLPTGIRGEVFLSTTIHPWPMVPIHLAETEQVRLVCRWYDSPATSKQSRVQQLVHWYQGWSRHPAVWVKNRQATVVFAGIPTERDLDHQFHVLQQLLSLKS